MSKSNALEADVLNYAVRNTALPANTGHVALLSAVDVEAGTFTETNAGGYARQPTLAAFATAATAGTISNSAAITFPQATAAATATVTHFAIMSALTAGRVLYAAALPGGGFTYGLNVQPSFAAGQLTVTED